MSCMYTYVHEYVETRGLPLLLFLRHHVADADAVPETKFLTGLIRPGWMTSEHCLPGLCLSLPPWSWDYNCAPFMTLSLFTWVLGIKRRFFCLSNKKFTNWAISLVPQGLHYFFTHLYIVTFEIISNKCIQSHTRIHTKIFCVFYNHTLYVLG